MQFNFYLNLSELSSTNISITYHISEKNNLCTLNGGIINCGHILRNIQWKEYADTKSLRQGHGTYRLADRSRSLCI